MRYQLASLIARAAKKRIFALEGVSFRGGSWAGEAAVWESDCRSAGGDSPGRILQGRRFASVDAVDREDHRPPSLRKSAARVEEVVLRAFPRLKPGRLCCKKERRDGLVPSIVFEQENGHLGGNKQLLSVEKRQLENIVNKIGRSFFMSRTFDLEIYDRPGQSLLSRETVLPRTIHLHAVTDQLLNVTFMKASPHSELKVEVPLVFIGEDSCPGIRKAIVRWRLGLVARLAPFMRDLGVKAPYPTLSAVRCGREVYVVRCFDKRAEWVRQYNHEEGPLFLPCRCDPTICGGGY